jgi:hypothetical protein
MTRVPSGLGLIAHLFDFDALGHIVKLMPPSYVKAYLKCSDNLCVSSDAAAGD